MNRYFRFLVTIIFLIMFTVSVYSKQYVHLGGRWDKVQRSLINDLPIQAWVEDGNEPLILFFKDNLGDVCVTVSDSSGTILYDQVIHTNEFASIMIPVEDMEGECMLSITDGKNNIFGQFSIN